MFKYFLNTTPVKVCVIFEDFVVIKWKPTSDGWKSAECNLSAGCLTHSNCCFLIVALISLLCVDIHSE